MDFIFANLILDWQKFTVLMEIYKINLIILIIDQHI